MYQHLRDILSQDSKLQRDVEKMFEHYQEHTTRTRDLIKEYATEWAKLICNHPTASLVLIETTPIVDKTGCYTHQRIGGIYQSANEPIRLTALSIKDKKIYDQLLKPTHTYQVKGSEYHGLNEGLLIDQPKIAEIWDTFKKNLKGPIVFFSGEWPLKALAAVGITLENDVFDLHQKCQDYYSVFYYLDLDTVLKYQGITSTSRAKLTNSMERVLVLLDILRNLAAGLPKEDVKTEEDELEDHPF